MHNPDTLISCTAAFQSRLGGIPTVEMTTTIWLEWRGLFISFSILPLRAALLPRLAELQPLFLAHPGPLLLPVRSASAPPRSATAYPAKQYPAQDEQTDRPRIIDGCYMHQ